MNALILILCMGVSCVAAFGFPPFQNSQASTASNVCIYSANAEKYAPKCFPCLTVVYTSALQACVNGTTMPSNITYASAKCMENNCNINYPTAPPLKAKSMPIFQFFKGFSDFLGGSAKTKRSIHDRSVQSVDQKQGINIVEYVQTFASDMEVYKEMSLDYQVLS